jgi:hypothetical protein
MNDNQRGGNGTQAIQSVNALAQTIPQYLTLGAASRLSPF